MFTTKLVHVVEKHRAGIAAAAIRRMREDPATPLIGALPDSTLSTWGKELAGSFGLWGEGEGREALARRFFEFGQERCREQLPLPELIRVCHIWRECSVSCLRDQEFQVTSLDIYMEEEVEYDLAGFFEFAAYHISRGYENIRTQKSVQVTSHENKKRFHWRLH